jgi:4-alpha-glucanotransferase
MGTPTVVSGCPPDAFSATGQLWGNPIYNWTHMKNNHYDWWVKRFRKSFEAFDMVRIDHFRGFEAYWQIPFGEETAIYGEWVKGPGIAFFRAIESALGGTRLPIIAEDLGILTDEVIAMRRQLGYPGMKILQFAFDTENESTYLPHFYTNEDIVYTGTHDNHTIMGWYKQAPKKERAYAKAYLKLERGSGYHWGFIEGLMRSSAGLVVIPMQDVLGQDDQARMNFPSTVGDNWRYRISKNAFNRKIARKLCDVTRLYSRLINKS